MPLENAFDSAMEDIYRRGGQEIGYWAKRFIRSVREKGGVATAKRMLQPQRDDVITDGLQALIDAGRIDLSLETLVLSKRFRSLFAAEELAEAERRLERLPRHAARRPVPPELNHPETLPERRTYEEGAVRRVLVSVYERDREARAACLRRHGTRCAVCGMSFEERYGDIGEGFIHVHHKKPLAACRASYQLDPEKDLVPVCPNCHAMLHTSDPPLSVEELKAKIKKQELEV